MTGTTIVPPPGRADPVPGAYELFNLLGSEDPGAAMFPVLLELAFAEQAAVWEPSQPSQVQEVVSNPLKPLKFEHQSTLRVPEDLLAVMTTPKIT